MLSFRFVKCSFSIIPLSGGFRYPFFRFFSALRPSPALRRFWRSATAGASGTPSLRCLWRSAPFRPLRCFWRSATAGAMRPMPPPARPSASTPSRSSLRSTHTYRAKKPQKGRVHSLKNIHYFTHKPYNLIFMVFFSHYGGEISLPRKRDTSFFVFFAAICMGYMLLTIVTSASFSEMPAVMYGFGRRTGTSYRCEVKCYGTAVL